MPAYQSSNRHFGSTSPRLTSGLRRRMAQRKHQSRQTRRVHSPWFRAKRQSRITLSAGTDNLRFYLEVHCPERYFWFAVRRPPAHSSREPEDWHRVVCDTGHDPHRPVTRVRHFSMPGRRAGLMASPIHYESPSPRAHHGVHPRRPEFTRPGKTTTPQHILKPELTPEYRLAGQHAPVTLNRNVGTGGQR